MKQLTYILALILVLGAVVPGCHEAPRYDGRLAQADSLMLDKPDSALALLEGLDGATLATKGDSAYRDLLLTQARYRCYITATSDSDINRALAYYSAHPKEREKLTRAYIYKGAVMDELGHPDSAMFYYKHAEVSAAPDDYFNLGYVNTRMGALYRDHYSMDGKQIVFFEKALECFNKTHNVDFQVRCMINLGSVYCLTNPQKADSLLKKALTIAENKSDTVTYILVVQNLIKNYLHQKDFFAAHRLAQKVISQKISRLSVPFCLYAASAYALTNEPDSSYYFLNIIHDIPITNEIDRLTYLETLRDISMAQRDTTNYLKYEHLSNLLNDSLSSSEEPTTINSIENIINTESEQQVKKSHDLILRSLLSLLSLAIITTLLVMVVSVWRKKNYQKQIAHLINTLEASESQIDEMRQFEQNFKRLNIQDRKLKEFIESYMKLMQDVVEECYHQPNLKHTQRIKDLISFQKSNKETWSRLFDYLDMEYNGIISQTKADFPLLNGKDLLLIAMTTLGFSYIQMAMIFGYSDASSMSSAKIRLVKKMRIDCTLNEYVSRFKTK